MNNDISRELDRLRDLKDKVDDVFNDLELKHTTHPMRSNLFNTFDVIIDDLEYDLLNYSEGEEE